MPRSPYPNLFSRLVSNTVEPENGQSCWLWNRRKDRWGYGRVEVYVPGLGRVKTLMAHIVSYACLEARCQTADAMYLAYLEITNSGLELDHECEAEGCIYADHLDLCTPKENCQRRDERHARKRNRELLGQAC